MQRRCWGDAHIEVVDSRDTGVDLVEHVVPVFPRSELDEPGSPHRLAVAYLDRPGHVFDLVKPFVARVCENHRARWARVYGCTGVLLLLYVNLKGQKNKGIYIKASPVKLWQSAAFDADGCAGASAPPRAAAARRRHRAIAQTAGMTRCCDVAESICNHKKSLRKLLLREDGSMVRKGEKNERTQTGGNTAGRNQATMAHFSEQRRQCEAHKARQLEIDATEARRLEEVRAAKERGKLYEWQARDAKKPVHATVIVLAGEQIMLGVPE